MESKSIFDNFEPIYQWFPRPFLCWIDFVFIYGVKIDAWPFWTYICAPFLCWIDFVCIYRVKINFWPFWTYISTKNQFLTILNLYVGVRRNAITFVNGFAITKLSRPSYPPTPSSPIRAKQTHSRRWSLNTQAYQLLGTKILCCHTTNDFIVLFRSSLMTVSNPILPERSVHGERGNFTMLVLGCIDSYDSEKRRILQHFSRSTRFAFLCTAQISNFQQKLRDIFLHFFRKFSRKFQNLVIFQQNLMNFAQNFTKRSENLWENRENVDLQKIF